jgi:5-methylcytosine-specific restriction endonuclease McrA
VDVEGLRLREQQRQETFRAEIKKWERRREEDAKREEVERECRRARYHEYLQSPEWRAKRDLVIRHADGLCQGCGIQPAEQVHHLTYQNIGNEFLWELRAVCRECHARVHEGDWHVL